MMMGIGFNHRSQEDLNGSWFAVQNLAKDGVLILRKGNVKLFVFFFFLLKWIWLIEKLIWVGLKIGVRFKH